MIEQDQPDRRQNFADARLQAEDETLFRTVIQLVRVRHELYGDWLSVDLLKRYLRADAHAQPVV